jgi:MFS family permease
MKTDSNGYSALENGSSKIKEMPESTKTHPVVYMVFLSLLLDLLAFTMILPLFPSLLDYYRTNDKDGLYVHLSNSVKYFQEWVGAPEKYTSVLFGGVLGSMFSFLQFLSAPLFGGLSDYYGRKRVMLVSLLGISLSYVVWALSKNFGIFVIARIIGGLSKGNISLCMAIITDVSNKNNRGKGMALVGIAFSIGFILGPMIGAMFSKFSDKSSSDWFVYPAMFAICLSVINILFVSLCLKETLPKEKRSKTVVNSLTQTIEHISIPALFRFDAVKNISKLDLKSLKQLGYVYFLYLFIYSGLEFTVTFLMYHKFNFNSMDQARMFLMTGVVMALLQGAVVRRIPPHLTKKSAVIGLYLIVPAYVIVGFAESVRILYLGMFLYSVSTAFVVTCLTTLASKYGNFDQKGVVLGIFRSLGALARALGPVIASTAFWSAGSTITYLVGGVILLYPTLLLQYSKLS